MIALVEIEEDRVSWHLCNWETWMRVGSVPGHWRDGRWYPSRASGRMGGSGSTDFDALVANVDTHCAAALDALIDGLPLIERLAVYHVHLAAVFRLSGDIPALYLLAKEHLTRGLALRGIW